MILTSVLWVLIILVAVAAFGAVVYLIVRFVNRGDSIAHAPVDRAHETPPETTPPT